jgi:hypothetical protein
VSAKHCEAANPRFRIFVSENLDDQSRQRQAPRIGQPHKQQAMMRSWPEFANIGKIEVLRDKESPRRLRSRPYIRVIVSRQPFLPHVIHIVV